MTIADNAALKQIASRQGGVVSRAQALARGVSEDAISRRLAGREWSVIHPGVYVLLPALSKETGLRQQLFAGLIWLGEGTGVSHRAAGLEWRLDGVTKAPLEFVTMSHRRSRRLVIHRVQQFMKSDLRTLGRMTVTSVERTLIDLASVVEADIVEQAFDCAIRKELTTLDRMSDRLRAGGLLRGTAAVRALVKHGRRPTDSQLEILTWQLIEASGLPLPERQFRVIDDQGSFVARVDFA